MAEITNAQTLTMDGLLAIAGLILLVAGILSLLTAGFLCLKLLFTNDPVAKASSLRSLKKASLLTALFLLVGTGICTLQFQLYPLNLH